MTYKKISFIIPAYNEEKTIGELLDKVKEVDTLGLDKEIIVVNDGSKDRTIEIVQAQSTKHKASNIILLNNEVNLGKSQTVRKGILASTGDLVVIQDADLEYNPHNLTEFIRLFQSEDYEVIYGNRFGKHNKVIYWQNWFGNRFLSLFSSIITYIKGGIWTNDMEVCYKMIKGDIFRDIAKSITAKSVFGFEPEVTAKLAKYRLEGKRLKFREVPIDYNPRSFAEGKKMHAIKDGLKAILEIIKYNFFS